MRTLATTKHYLALVLMAPSISCHPGIDGSDHSALLVCVIKLSLLQVKYFCCYMIQLSGCVPYNATYIFHANVEYVLLLFPILFS